MIDPEETEDDCLLTYWRMFNNSGFSDDVPFTNGITYDDFRKGYYFSIFDLSTSSKCNSSQLIPGKYMTYAIKYQLLLYRDSKLCFFLAIRVGQLRVKIQFSSPLPYDVTCLMHSEVPAALFLNTKTKSVKGTFI
ncbi:MAG: hypothetical protein FJ333_10880 [Sphingomonadales bacterium]|nr:hypothetical protein [Sphingomonadales bacterium]